ncbi:M50 family metallopeptidase [Pseudopontixanthobacter vadosimaris]|uniref:M50 family metallopeptidase n=1 Tax=Pseudopontixanthobacter vadosimaris TaxID=2726450 RepID=UPI001474B549|nr:M50 family metallopeptidase [Pseudopontixanthobacter vadosimaris]
MDESFFGSTQRLLLGIAFASLLLWQTSFGRILLHPFTILATWFHEMGHGIPAMLSGSRFERLLIYPDGSGVALSLRPRRASRLTEAMIGAVISAAIVGLLWWSFTVAFRTSRAA